MILIRSSSIFKALDTHGRKACWSSAVVIPASPSQAYLKIDRPSGTKWRGALSPSLDLLADLECCGAGDKTRLGKGVVNRETTEDLVGYGQVMSCRASTGIDRDDGRWLGGSWARAR